MFIFAHIIYRFGKTNNNAIMPKYKSLQELANILKQASKAKRPRIKPATRQYEKVNYTPRVKPLVEQPKGSTYEADQLMNDLDHYIQTYDIDPATYPRSVRKIVYNAAKNGTYGPTGNNIRRNVSDQVLQTPDFFRYGPNSAGNKIDRDLQNANTAYDVIGLNVKEQAPGIARDFLNSGLQEAEGVIGKPVVKSLRPQPNPTQQRSARPVTTLQSDREIFYRPEFNADIHSTYETTEPESFEDMYRRLTGYTGKLLDKNGGKLYGKYLK